MKFTRLLIALLMLSASPAWAAIATVPTEATGTSQTAVTSGGLGTNNINVTAGDIWISVIRLVGVTDTSTTANLSAACSNESLTKAGSQNNGVNTMVVFYRINSGGGTACGSSVSFSVPTSYRADSYLIRGALTASPFDPTSLTNAQSGTFASATTATTSTFSQGLSDELVLCFVATDSAQTIAPNGGETEPFTEYNSRLQLQYISSSTAGNKTCSWSFGSATAGVYWMFGVKSSTSSSAPTFSVSPAVGTRTTSTIPVTATTACTDCNYYGVAVTDGSGAPTCTQIKAGQNSGGTSAYKAFGAVAMTTTVQNTGTFSTYTDGTVRDGYFCLNSTGGGDSAVSSIADMYKLPAFTSGPTFSSCTSTGCTYSLTLDGAGTVYGVACKADLTAATVTQVEAAQCTGAAAATASANKAVTGADTLTIGSALDYPIHDFAIVGVYGSQHEAAIHADNARLKSAPTGYIYDTLASVSATSWCNGISSPAAAATDVNELTSPTDILGQTVTVDGTCDWVFNNSGARDRICDRLYDRSVKDWMSVTSPSASCSGTRAAIWFNNQPPIFITPIESRAFKTGVAYSLDICALAIDAEGDTLTNAVTTGTLTTGLAVGGTGNCVVSGTVANGDENEAGNTVVFTVTDIAGDTATYTVTLFPINTITVPTCIGEQAATYQSALDALFVTSAVTVIEPSVTIPAGYIVSCSPAAGQEVDPFSGEVDLTMSLGVAGTGLKRPQIRFGIGIP